MKTRLTILKLVVILCSTFATVAVFGQRTFTWTGTADRTNLATAGNWDLNALPSGATQDTAQWDSRTASDLVLSYGGGFPDTGFGTMGINFVLTENQANGVTIISPVAQSGNIGLFGITNNSSSAAFVFGDGTANRLNFVGRPAGALHVFENNSTTPATINPSVRWQAGGGNLYTLDFGGLGDWTVNNYLRNDNNAPSAVTVTGPGKMAWTGAGAIGNSRLQTININGGTLLLKSAGLVPVFPGEPGQIIANSATLNFDAAGQSETIARAISGAGTLIVSAGTLALSGANTYGGNTVLTNTGILIVNGTENVTDGPLGAGGVVSFGGGTLQWSVNNTYDYSGRFSFEVDQAYKFDTAGQSVTLATPLISPGGTLTKTGSGTLTLSGESGYDGVTKVSGGKLVFQGAKPGTGAITVDDGAALGVAVTPTPVTPSTLTLGTSAGVTLEFDGVSSTTIAPIAAVTLSSGGTVTVNISSGSFAVGQSYPLFAWTSGSAPRVSLGTVSGAVGNLSTNLNSINLNITAVALIWSGANNGNWDTTTANNWLFNGTPTAYSDPSLALFNDTASGTTTVTVNGVVRPTAVTVNNSTKAYSIASSSVNNISGGSTLTKSGNGPLTLSGGVNAYTGASTIIGGMVSVGTLANGGSPSDIGASGSVAENLRLNGGALQYTGGAASIDRLFTLGTGSGTIDAAGSGALVLNNPGPIGLSGLGARVLTLTGSSTDDNALAAALGNSGAGTSLAKSGAGKWVLTGSNTYSGGTSIAAGTLQVGNGGASGSLGAGNITDNGVLIFNRSGTVTNGVISGNGSVTVEGGGTVVLPGNNSYAGGTTITAGTLQVGTGGVTGQLNGNISIVNDGTLIFHSTGAFAMNAGSVISGTGGLIKRGSGLLKLIGNNTYTGGTTIDAGAQLQVAEGNQGSISGDIINNGTLIFVRQDNAALIINGVISGTGSMVKDINNPNAGDVTLTGSNTYTGGTTIRGGAVIVGDGGNNGWIVGHVLFTNSLVTDTARTLTFNRSDDLTFSGNIVGGVVLGQGGAVVQNAGAVVQQGSGILTLTGTGTYPGGTTINGGTLQVGAGGTSGSVGPGPIVNNSQLIFNRSDNSTFGGVISGGGSLVKLGSGTLTLTASNTYNGSTTVNDGTLLINGDHSAPLTTVNTGTLGGIGTFAGAVTLQPETTLAPGAAIGTIGTLTINADLTIGGNLAIEVNKSLSPANDLVVVGGALANIGPGTLTVVNLGPALAAGDKFALFSRPVTSGAAITVTGAGATWSNNLETDGSITVTSVVGPPTLTFSHTGNSLQFSWTGSLKLQAQTNSLTVGLTTNWVDYPGGGSSPVTVPIDVTKATVFFRLLSTP